jgi:hypothetical protein
MALNVLTKVESVFKMSTGSSTQDQEKFIRTCKFFSFYLDT